ncbi:hypothetical protein CN918_32255 [Priestia megaterium]|nr:hypothetical protein CN918_32255 [Priestia megaterium]
MLGANEKVSYFQPYAPFIYEDGTFESLSHVVKRHWQSNVIIIERAAEEISRYITFNMEHWEEVWSIDKNEYIHFPKKGDNIDPFDRIIHFDLNDIRWGKYDCIHIDDSVDDLLLSDLLRIKKELLAVRFTPTKEDNERWEKYECDITGRYGFLLSKMLDGHTFFSE